VSGRFTSTSNNTLPRNGLKTISHAVAKPNGSEISVAVTAIFIDSAMAVRSSGVRFIVALVAAYFTEKPYFFKIVLASLPFSQS